MPTFSVKPVTAEWSIDDEAGKTTGTTVYLVTSDDLATPLSAIGATGVPLRGSVYPDAPIGSTLKCAKRSCKPQGQTRMIFKVTCEYDSTSTLNPNPLSDPTAFDYGDETNDEPYFTDEADEPTTATTTALEPFPELPRRQRSVLVISFERNVPATATYSTYKAFRNTVNSAAVTIDGTSYAARTLLVGKVSLSAVKTRDGYSYRTLSGELREDERTWDQKFESRGLYELGDDYFPIPITDDDGVVVDVPWPLDGDGHKLDDPSATGAMLTLKPYKQTAIGGLFA